MNKINLDAEIAFMKTAANGLDTNWLPLFSILRSRQNGWLFVDDIFRYIVLNDEVWISIKISLKFDP